MMDRYSIYRSAAGEKAVMDFYDSVLARWPVPYRTLNIPTQYGSTFVIVSGEPTSSPLILLHGAGTNSAVWAGDVADYSRYYQVYAVDLLGEPGKSDPDRPDWNGPAYAEWLGEVIRQLGIHKPTIVGISQGGWTALKYAVADPGNIDQLVLICPGGIVRDKLSFVLRAVVYTLLGQRGIRSMVRLLYADQPTPPEVEEVTALMLSSFKARTGILPVFSDEELKRLTLPVLLLGGSRDALRDMDKIAARMQQFLPQLQLQIIPGAGHAVLNTVKPILSFLRREHDFVTT